eukprot:jgi/Botrbrau1/4272/Bobra.0390s0012.1
MFRRLRHGTSDVENRPPSPFVGTVTEVLSNENQILLQCFNWECWSCRDPSWWTILKFKAQTIADAGITTCWLPPPSLAVDQQGYLPLELENLNSKYGTQEELKDCIQTLHSNRLLVLGDIVVNHRCAKEQGLDGKWNKYTGRYPWDHTHITPQPANKFGGTGRPKDETRFRVYEAAPNVDHTNERVRQDIISWMQWLRWHLGYDGWRFDFAKGYAPSYVLEYIENTQPTFSVGEYWDDCEYDSSFHIKGDQDRHRKRIMDWIDATDGKAAAFDFTTKGLLQEAVQSHNYSLLKKDGQPPGVIGWWGDKAVTFIDNHDTGSIQNHWPFPQQHLQQGYAYILTHPGIPCIFWDHLFTEGVKRSFWRRLKSLLYARNKVVRMGRRSWVLRPLKDVIIYLIRLRRVAGIRSGSQVVIHEAKKDCYAATVNGNLIIRLGATHWAPSLISSDLEGWTVAMTGYHFTIWLRSSLQMPEDPAAAFRRGRSSKLPLSAMSAGPST